MENVIENVQIYPSKKRIVPNFKLAKVTSNLSEQTYNNLLNGKNAQIIEKRNYKAPKITARDIFSPFTITNAEGYDNTDPLTTFDYDVLSVCISEWEAGNHYTTSAIIMRGLTGKVGKGDTGIRIQKNQRFAIMQSLLKLMGTFIEADFSDANQLLKYGGKANRIISAILPAYIVIRTINGKFIEDAVYFDRESPMLTVAKDRKQLLTYDTELLNVPNQNNTPLVITLKNYVIRRILEIKAHKMTRTLTFDDIFQKARITEKKSNEKAKAREYIVEFLQHLQNKGVIKNFELTKQKNTFYSIKFS